VRIEKKNNNGRRPDDTSRQTVYVLKALAPQQPAMRHATVFQCGTRRNVNAPVTKQRVWRIRRNQELSIYYKIPELKADLKRFGAAEACDQKRSNKSG
jgi:hypothetical protein